LFAISVKAVEHREITLARHAENVGDALLGEALDDEMAGDL
jgi:hypothetical protein